MRDGVPSRSLRQAPGASRGTIGSLRYRVAASGLVPQAPFCTTSQHRVISCSAGPPFSLPQSSSIWISGIQNVCPFHHQLHCQAPLAQAVDDPAGQLVYRRRRLQETRTQVIIALPLYAANLLPQTIQEDSGTLVCAITHHCRLS